MKLTKIFSLISFFMVVAGFTSCSSDNEPIDPTIILNPEPEPTNGEFKVDIDGTTYTAATTMVYISGGSIQLTALRAQGDSFGFLLTGNTPGTYAANDNIVAYNPANSEFGYWGVNPANESENTGSVVVTSIDAENHTISGTFSFTGYWSDDTATGIAPKHFTNGTFTNLPYTTSSPTNDVFAATINGAAFSPIDILAITTTIGGDEYISIGVENAAGDTITVSVKSTLSAGSYPITGNLTTDKVQLIFSNSQGQGIATIGSVVITQKTSTRIKGTFTGTVTIGSTAYQITTGSFDVEY